MSFDNYTDLPVNSAGLVVTPLGDIPLPYFLQVVTVVFIFTLSVFSGSSLWMMFDLWSMFMYGLIQLLFPFIFIPQVSTLSQFAINHHLFLLSFHRQMFWVQFLRRSTSLVIFIPPEFELTRPNQTCLVFCVCWKSSFSVLFVCFFFLLLFNHRLSVCLWPSRSSNQ